jgi:TPR repeat protein
MQMPTSSAFCHRLPRLRRSRAARFCLVLAALVLAALTSPARAGFDEAYAEYDRGNYAAALNQFLSLARAGDPHAQSAVAFMYHRGEGVPQDYAEAVKWYRRAAEEGVPQAQQQLGLLYYNGRGVRRDYTEAVKWIRRAAEQGFTDSQFRLAGC